MKKIRNVKEMHENAMNTHNSDELLQKYVTNIATLEQEKAEIVSKIKEEKRSAKEDGFLVTAIAGAVRDLRSSQEQRDTRDNVAVERQRIFEICLDLPLFASAA